MDTPKTLQLQHDLQMALPGRPNPVTGLNFMEELIVLEAIGGGERGFNQRADVLTRTRDGVDANTLWREFLATVRMLNRDRDALVNRLTFSVDRQVEGVMVPTGEEDFEEMSEFGQPKGIRGAARRYYGYDYKLYDLAVRYTWMFLAKASADEVRQLNEQALQADRRLIFTRIMRRIFNSSNNPVTPADGIATTAYPFYNADGEVPPTFRGTAFAGTHTHYLTSGAATIDAGDMAQLEDHLYHHGYRLGMGYNLVVLMNKAQADTVRTFVAGTAGALYTFIPKVGSAFNAGVLVNFRPDQVVATPNGTYPGEIGSYGPFIVVQEDYIPAGYVVALASGGERNIGNPVGVYEDPDYGRGLTLVPGRDGVYPLTDSFYRHGFGTGVRHRGAGVIMQITAAGTYTAPAAYA